MPACNEVQCGWAASHSLEGAQELAKNMLAKKDVWRQVFADEQNEEVIHPVVNGFFVDETLKCM